MENRFFKRDVISIENFSREDLDFLLNYAFEIKKDPGKFKEVMKGKVMAPLFFENSTRTSMSFQMAMHQLAGRVLDFDPSSSSLKKGETLSDTIKMVEGYFPDVVVMRHPSDGSAQLAADLLGVPLINAGDGQNQHPTQTMLDLFSIKEVAGKIDGVEIGMVGDLKYGRTVHSLAIALTKYQNCRIYFVSSESLRIPEPFLKILRKKGIVFSEHGLEDLQNVAEKVDVLYMTRVQRERFPEGPEGEQEYQRVKEKYCLKKQMLKGVKLGFKVMHPLPKVFEIEAKIDNSSYAYYFEQASNGLHIRKALLYLTTTQ
ncbi:MAG: aspartate carbamoyltransferase [archaeon]